MKKHIESIFDHNPSQEELKRILGGMTVEEYQKIFMDDDYDPDDLYKDIARLYFYREDVDNVRKYVSKIHDIMRQQSFWRTFLHP